MPSLPTIAILLATAPAVGRFKFLIQFPAFLYLLLVPYFPVVLGFPVLLNGEWRIRDMIRENRSGREWG